jgi:hypothetical protein
MTTSETTLEDAINSFDRLSTIESPLLDLPVETAQDAKVKGHKGQGLWLFATDNDKIYAHVYKPAEVDSRFGKTLVPMFQTAYGQAPPRAGLWGKLTGNNPQEQLQTTLTFHNYVSLLIHELYHPKYCPSSTWSKDEDGTKTPGDRELVVQAISSGIKKAMPGIKEADLTAKTMNIQNTVWDLCIDAFQYYDVSIDEGEFHQTLKTLLDQSGYGIDGNVIDELPEGVITEFDVISYTDMAALPKSVLSLNKQTYSLLFCADLDTRTHLLNYFEPKIKAGGIPDVETRVVKSLQGLVKEVPAHLLSEVGVDAGRFKQAVTELYSNRFSATYDNKYVMETVNKLLRDDRCRYSALEGYIQPLADLIQLQNTEKGRHGEKGYGGGQPQPGDGGEPGDEPGDQPGDGAGDGQSDEDKDLANVVEAITDAMDPKEAQSFLQGLANGCGTGGNPYLPQLQALGRDDYYKKHSPEITIETPDAEARIIQLGKRKEWVKTESYKVPATELHRHQRWVSFGLQQNLPVLQELIKEKLYVVNYFKEVETNLESFDFQNKGIDVARNWVLINDSSGSMGQATPGCGSKWDSLLHINYGLLKTLHKAQKVTDQEVDVWVVNFSGGTHLQGPVPLREFYQNPTATGKRELLMPQHGGTTLDTGIFPKIKKQLHPGRTVWSYNTDGDIWNSSDVERQIRSDLHNNDYNVLFFELMFTSTLGSTLKSLQKTTPNLTYQSVTNLKQILNQSLGVLIKYD